VSLDLSRTSEPEPAAAAKPAGAAAGPDRTARERQREQLTRIAQEFESMLLVQVLRDMRRAGSWEDGDDAVKGFGAQIMGDTIDVELAGHLARAKGLGLATQLLQSMERMDGVNPPAAVTGEPAGGPQPAHDADPGLTLTSAFGWRKDPFTGREKFHNGIDLAAVYGQDVQAARAGRVAFSGAQGGYGTTVVIEHADGTRSRYAHLSATLVAPGTMVTAGQLVGRAGSSGRATGTHLHFEVTGADGQPLSPSEWSNGRIG